MLIHAPNEQILVSPQSVVDISFMPTSQVVHQSLQPFILYLV